MSVFHRDADNSNCALLVSVTPEDFGSNHALAGIEFQRQFERTAFRLTNSYRVPTATMEDIYEGKTPKESLGQVKPSYPIGTFSCSPNEYFPKYITNSLSESFRDFDDWMPGFYLPDAVLSGPETRTTAPIRMLRDEKTRQAVAHPHVYPSGEGAGYAGGIVTSAYDGMLSALALLQKCIIN